MRVHVVLDRFDEVDQFLARMNVGLLVDIVDVRFGCMVGDDELLLDIFGITSLCEEDKNFPLAW